MKNMVTNWFTADNHFGHANIIEYCNRPFKSLEHMDREMIRRWNERVKPEDIVYHLGDFCFKETDGKRFKYYRDQLNGDIVFIRGNHDHNNGSKAIITTVTIDLGGHDWYMEHYPNKVLKFNLHGHVHTLWKIKREEHFVLINVGVDVWDFYPINIQEILGEIYKH